MKRVVLLCLVLLAAWSVSPSAFGQESLKFKAALTGGEEVPPVSTAATGEAKFAVNPERTQIAFELEIMNATDILGAAGAHIHCGQRGQNGPVVVFLAGAVQGGLDGKVEIKAVLTGANIVNTACGATIADLVQAMLDGRTYANAHSPAHPGGEIRGQIVRD